MESRQRLLCKSLGASSCRTKDLIIFIFVLFPYSCSHLSIILLWFQYPVFYVLVLAPSLGIRDIWDFFSSNLNNEIHFFSPKSPMSQYAHHHSPSPPPRHKPICLWDETSLSKPLYWKVPAGSASAKTQGICLKPASVKWRCSELSVPSGCYGQPCCPLH